MTFRDLALLQAVLTGRAQMICGWQPHLLVDGRHVCDTDTHPLTTAGLIAPAIPGQPGMQVLAILTDAGRAALGVAA